MINMKYENSTSAIRASAPLGSEREAAIIVLANVQLPLSHSARFSSDGAYLAVMSPAGAHVYDNHGFSTLIRTSGACYTAVWSSLSAENIQSHLFVVGKYQPIISYHFEGNSPIDSAVMPVTEGSVVPDTFSGVRRLATYTPLNSAYEPQSALSIAVDEHNKNLFAGCDRGTVQVFDIDRPGQPVTNFTLRKLGIVSSIAFSESLSLLACGTFNSMHALLDARVSEIVHCEPVAAGVSHLRMDPSSLYAFIGYRRSSRLDCYDLRMRRTLSSLQRRCNNNQRLIFDISPDGRWLISGEALHLNVYDLHCSEEPDIDGLRPPSFKFLIDDTVNSCAFHPFFNSNYPVVVITTGTRQSKPSHVSQASDDDSSTDEEHQITDMSLRQSSCWGYQLLNLHLSYDMHSTASVLPVPCDPTVAEEALQVYAS